MHAFLLRWQTLLDWSHLRPLIDFWELFMRGVEGVVAWARFRLINAALEATTVACADSASTPTATATLATSCSCSITRPGSTRGAITRMRDERP